MAGRAANQLPTQTTTPRMTKEWVHKDKPFSFATLLHICHGRLDLVALTNSKQFTHAQTALSERGNWLLKQNGRQSVVIAWSNQNLVRAGKNATFETKVTVAVTAKRNWFQEKNYFGCRKTYKQSCF